VIKFISFKRDFKQVYFGREKIQDKIYPGQILNVCKLDVKGTRWSFCSGADWSICPAYALIAFYLVYFDLFQGNKSYLVL
jgi:hypothetical protein